MRTGKVSLVAPIFSSFAVVSIVFGVLVFGERPTLVQAVAATVVVLGVIIATFPKRSLKGYSIEEGVVDGLIGMLLIGLFFPLLALVGSQSSWVFLVLMSRLALVALAGALIWHRTSSVPLIPDGKVLPRLFVIGTLSGLATLSVTFGLRISDVSLVTPISSASPIPTILLGVFLLKERLLTNQALGTFLVVAGIIISSI